MTREEMHDYMLSLPHTVCDYKEEWDAFLYKIEGKFYAMMADQQNAQPIISLKCNPARAIELREQFPDDIKPGYYLNKAHWNSINIKNGLADSLLQDLISHAHELIFNALPKKKQKELNESL